MSAVPRMVATDLDGTIVRSDARVTGRTTAALARAMRAGAVVVAVTGRPPRLLEGIPEAFGYQGIAVCSNGALLVDLATAKVVAENRIAPSRLTEAARILRAALPGIGLAVEFADSLWGDEVYELGDWDTGVTIQRLADADLFSRPAPKLVGRHPRMSADELLAVAGPLLATIVTPYHANGVRLVEAVALGVSKAAALQELADGYGIDPVDVIAFGDMPNDLPMLAWAGTSYAVGNAHPDVLAAVDHVIGANDDDGVAEVLEQLFPIGADR